MSTKLTAPAAPLFTNAALKKLLVPLVIEQTLAVTVGMADTMMVSSVGEAAVSGVSLVDMVINLIFQVFAALSTGGAVVVSQYLGARRRDKACGAASQLLVLSVLAGVGIMALMLALATPMLRLFFGSIEVDVMAAALTYLRINALSFPFLALYNAGAALFRSMGNSAVSMRVSVLVNLLNIVGNAICIFGLHMGVAGVALPSLISRSVGAVLIFLQIRNPQNQVFVQYNRQFRLVGSTVHRILYIGVPSAFENSLFQLGRIVVVSIIAGFGTTQIAANAVANNLDAVGCIAGQAYGLGLITVVGQCVGAQDCAQARYYVRKLMRQSYLIQGAVNILIIFTLTWSLQLYSLSGETLALARWLVTVHAGFAILMWPASFVLPNALRAANDVRFTMVVSIASMVVWRLGFSYILGARMGMGARGVWIAMVVDWVCRTTCFVTRYLSGKWETKYVA